MTVEFTPVRTGALEVDRNFNDLRVRMRDVERRLLALENAHGFEVVASGIVQPTAAVQDITIPVSDGNGAGLVTAHGILIGESGTVRNVTALVNGATTNVTMQRHEATGGSGGIAGTSTIASLDNDGAFFTLTFYTRQGTRRMGHLFFVESNGPTVYTSGIFYTDAATPITSLSLRNAVAAGFAVGSCAFYEERRLP